MFNRSLPVGASHPKPDSPCLIQQGFHFLSPGLGVKHPHIIVRGTWWDTKGHTKFDSWNIVGMFLHVPTRFIFRFIFNNCFMLVSVIKYFQLCQRGGVDEKQTQLYTVQTGRLPSIAASFGNSSGPHDIEQLGCTEQSRPVQTGQQKVKILTSKAATNRHDALQKLHMKLLESCGSL